MAAEAGGAQEGAAAPGGFALLLAALADGAVDGACLPGAVSATASATGAASAAAEDGDAPPPFAGLPDAGALAAWMAGLQPPAALAQAAGAAVGGATDALAGRVGLGLVRPGQDSLVGQTAWLDGAAEAAALNGTSQDMSAAPPMGRGGAARAQPWSTAQAGQGVADSGPGHATARVAAAQAVQAGMEQVAAQAAGAPVIERRDALQAAMAQPPAWAEADPAATAFAAGGLAGTLGAAAGAGPAAAVAGAGAAALPAGDGTQGLEQPSAPAAQGFDGAIADAAQAGMGGAEDQLADQLAEQVAFWVHHKTQSAELTLDQGGRPVEVRVALTGDQAHVSLRSDQAEARALLDSGREQLHDMLQRQGLQLTGMTVGTSGGDGAAARQDGRAPGRQGAQRASVPAAAPAGTVHRGGGVGERSVDIFV